MGSGWPGHQKGEPVFEIDWHQFNLGYVPASRPQRTLGHGCIFVVAFANSTFQNWRARGSVPKIYTPHDHKLHHLPTPPNGGGRRWVARKVRCVCSSLYYEIVHTISATHQQQHQQQHKTDGGKSGNRNELAPGREWVGWGLVWCTGEKWATFRVGCQKPSALEIGKLNQRPPPPRTQHTTPFLEVHSACLHSFRWGNSRGIIGKICC